MICWEEFGLILESVESGILRWVELGSVEDFRWCWGESGLVAGRGEVEKDAGCWVKFRGGFGRDLQDWKGSGSEGRKEEEDAGFWQWKRVDFWVLSGWVGSLGNEGDVF